MRWTPAPIRSLAAIFLALGSLAVAAEKETFTKNEKAFFLEPKEQAFIRPGLAFEILGASISDDRTVRYRFRVTDPRGAPLDLEGVETPGEISVRSVIAYIPGDSDTYRAYTTRTQTSSSTGQSAEQATADTGGSFEQVGPGEYEYTFGARAPEGFDRSATHTVAAWVARDLEEFELGAYAGADTFDWVPDGSPVVKTRNVVADAKCNQCHGVLSAHDERTTVAVCITCHTPQSSDPDSGNTVDMATMVHKIHMGANLPSVQAGNPYQIIGFGNSVHDYSTVHYPADVRICQTCHLEDLSAVEAEPARNREIRAMPARGRVASRAIFSAPPEQQDLADAAGVNAHLLEPTRADCGSCHDEVNFATGENHAGGLVQASDNQCAQCHTPTGELPFDASIVGAHIVPRLFDELPGTNFEIVSVSGTAPGQNPTVTFSIRNDAGDPVAPADMGRLALVLAGTTADTPDYTQYVSENATSAEGSGGTYTYTFGQAISEDARGTWAVGIEGYRNATVLPGTVQEVTVRDAGENKVMRFAVSGGAAGPRREVVTDAKCNACHYGLSVHGDNRNQIAQCVLCHNPTTTDAEVRPEDQMPPESVNLKEMIHRIHTGEELPGEQYIIYGFGATPHDFGEVRYPHDRAQCLTCHAEGSYELPLAANAAPTVDPRGFFDPAPAATGSCLSCHASMPAAAHADLNISPNFGESCDVCHGEGAEFAVARSHAR